MQVDSDYLFMFPEDSQSKESFLLYYEVRCLKELKA